uniref:Sushi domain containing 5 n=1 Tax=Amphiprion percula TaxID=161767 RepID=A0A3P8T7C9_AMPPE
MWVVIFTCRYTETKPECSKKAPYGLWSLSLSPNGALLAILYLISPSLRSGRVFVLDLRNSTGLQGFRDAERTCASQHAHLASAEELRHAVVECFFSPCTRGWLLGGTVGTTVCNIVGSALKAVDVRIENATDDTTHLDAFCIKDNDVPCGDPPSFPNARLQGHSGFEMGDELLYACVPGYVMPGGQTAFSLLCDSCGEWYGLVQICVKGKEEHPDHDDHDDHDDGEEHYDHEDDHYSDHDDHDDHDHKDDDSYDDHDSHEDDDGRQHLIVSMATDERQNTSQRGVKATTDETWLDGYPVVPEETENGDSTTERVRPDGKERGTVTKTTDRPNEVEIRRPVSYTSLPEEHESPTTVPELDHGVVEEVWPGFIRTPAPSADHLEPSDSPSYSDTLDYDTQQAAPTHSWLGDLTEHPFLDHGLAPPVHDDDDDVFTGTVEEHNLPGETGERGEMEGEMGETICVGENCPPRPPSSSSRGPTVAAIIVAVCAVATAVIVGVWCYRRQQQKSSVYEMNGKGQSQSRQGQQIEMQQKV